MDAKESSLKAYLDEIGNHPILTKEQEVEVFTRLRNGDPTAREAIIRSNLRFVIRIARQFVGRGMPLEDLIQEGNIGLMEVINKFDHRKGFRFSTYAAFWIRQSIQQALRKHSNLIRLPMRKSRLLGVLSDVVEKHRNTHGREPSLCDLAQALDLSEENTALLLRMRDSILSLDETQEDGVSLRDVLPAPPTASPVDRVASQERSARVREVLNHLTEKERHVVRLRFGFDTEKPLSLRRTSRLVGLSQEGVRRVEQKALSKLRRPSICMKVAGLL
ncbi:MAG: RNA polymerase sigma factor RpoD/SigA [Candidatus Sumerlaeota bacterium]|nr:RNA polymerase sigma factor RpoD/SigA [Candidatus Sumerlaeota bacterium]